MELLSFVIPCYRSEQTIASVVDKIIETVTNDGRYDYEIICVNDCSPDNTLDVLNRLADSNEKIIVLDLARNFGQHSAIMAGFNYVSGDIIVCLDDDGQTPPEECFKLIDKLNEGYDLVSAKYPKKKESLFRRFGSWTAKKMADALGVSLEELIVEPISSVQPDGLSSDEINLIDDYRQLSSQGKEYIRQTMVMAVQTYAGKNHALSDLEDAK